jgi:hypothetical protein
MSTTVTTASLSDSLASTVPKLDSSGSNWAIFNFRFQDAIEAKGFWGHFDGTAKPPTFANPSPPTADETIAMNQWKKDERSTDAEITRFDRCDDPFEDDREGEMGDGGGGILSKERVCQSGYAGQVYGHEVS